VLGCLLYHDTTWHGSGPGPPTYLSAGVRRRGKKRRKKKKKKRKEKSEREMNFSGVSVKRPHRTKYLGRYGREICKPQPVLSTLPSLFDLRVFAFHAAAVSDIAPVDAALHFFAGESCSEFSPLDMCKRVSSSLPECMARASVLLSSPRKETWRPRRLWPNALEPGLHCQEQPRIPAVECPSPQSHRRCPWPEALTFVSRCHP
jgi:hypothetical protein